MLLMYLISLQCVSKYKPSYKHGRINEMQQVMKQTLVLYSCHHVCAVAVGTQSSICLMNTTTLGGKLHLFDQFHYLAGKYWLPVHSHTVCQILSLCGKKGNQRAVFPPKSWCASFNLAVMEGFRANKSLHPFFISPLFSLSIEFLRER